MAEVEVKGGHYSYADVLRNMKFDLNQSIISCVPVPSLAYITLVRIVIKLWQLDIRTEHACALASNVTEESNTGYLCGPLYCLEIFEKKVLKKVSNLQLPLFCKEAIEQMIPQIREEIFKYFYAGDGYCFDTLDKFQMHWDNLCWTDQGTINGLKTALQIIDHPDVNIVDKFRLACNNCLEEKIRELHEKLPEDFVNIKKEGALRDLVRYWYLYIIDEMQRFSEIGESTTEYLLMRAFRKKDLAVKYIWENLADETLKDRMTSPDFINKIESSNIILYLFNEENIKLEQVSVKMGYNLLKTLHRISSWCKDFSFVEKCALELIKRKNIFDAFEIVIFCWHQNMVDSKQYTSIWDGFALYFKLEIEKQFEAICKEFLNLRIVWDRYDMLTCTLLIRMGTWKDKKKVLYSFDGMAVCLLLISGKGPEVFEWFINEMLATEKEKSRFKKVFFSNKIFDVCCFMINESKYEVLSEVLRKYCGEEKMEKLKNKLPYSHMANIIHDFSMTYVFPSAKLLEGTDEFLSWCFEGNVGKINKCKAILFDVESKVYKRVKSQFFKRINKLVRKGNWELVEKYWRWILLATVNKSSTSEEKLARVRKIVHLTFLRCASFCEFSRLFIKFLTSFEENEANELKGELKNSNELNKIVKLLLRLDKNQDCNDLLDWCFSSNKDEINKFKKKFMNLSAMGCELLLVLIEEDDCTEHKVKSLFAWFNPSVDLVKSFKKKFIDFVTKRRHLELQSIKHDGTRLLKRKMWKKVMKRVHREPRLLTYIDS